MPQSRRKEAIGIWMRNTLVPGKGMREIYPPLGRSKNKGLLYI